MRTIIASSRTLNPPRLTCAEHNLAMKQFTRPRISPSYLNACFHAESYYPRPTFTQIGYLFKDLYRQVIIRSPKKLGYFRSRWAHRDPKRSDPSVKFLACLSYLRTKVSLHSDSRMSCLSHRRATVTQILGYCSYIASDIAIFIVFSTVTLRPKQNPGAPAEPHQNLNPYP